MLRKYTALFLLTIAFYPAYSHVFTKMVTVKFGVNNQLIINSKTGLYSVKYGALTIIADAAAAYTIPIQKYNTRDYSKRTITLSNLTDKIGTGKVLTLTSTQAGLPIMVQRFYCYNNKPFVVTELEIQGEKLKSNYMAPLMAIKASAGITTGLQTLLVPFDNDTFIRYQSNDLSNKPNTSSEVGVVYNAQSRSGLVIGSLNHDNWKSGVKTAGTGNVITKLEAWGGLNELAITRDSMPHGFLKGDKIKSPKMFIGYFNDWRTGLEIYAKTNSTIDGRYVKAWHKATPVGWNSWGVIGSKLNYENAIGVADFFNNQIPDFRNEDGAAYLDLDSYWDNMVKGGFNGDFSKLKDFVNYCKERHLEPGIYWAPLVDWGFRSKNKERIAEGGNYKFADMWTKTTKGYHDIDGARALDPTHPGTKARIAFVLGKLKECGFKMIKIDFLGHAAAESTKFYDPEITTGMQAYKVGMQTVTDALGDDMLIYAAISPSMATAPYVHMRRIACDAFKSIKDTEYTLNSITYGWWQTYMYDFIDADHLVFEKESVGANRARLISGLISGPIILGDDYSKQADWQAQIKQWLQRPEIKQLINSGKAFMPVDNGDANGASQTFIRKDGTGVYLAVFNYKKQALNIKIDFKRIGLTTNQTYNFTEILGGNTVKGNNNVTITFDTEGAFIYKVNAN